MSVIGADLVEFAHRLADASGRAILQHYRSGLVADNKRAATPGDFDPVTAADREAEQVIRALLHEVHPEHGIIGEEFGSDRADADYVWVIDPIDGTRSFMAGQPVWGTLIALLRNSRPVFGMLDQPFLGERFWGDGASATMTGPQGRRTLATRRPVQLADAVVWVSSAVWRDPAMAVRVTALGKAVRMLQTGADCYTVAMLAEGHVDIVIGFGGFEIYDIAAHIPLVAGAGGIVTALDGADALHADAMIAGGDAECHAAALAVLAGAT